MTLKEIQQLKPGTRVFIMHRGEKISGVYGNGYSANGIMPLIKFDNGAVAEVNEKTAAVIQLELLN